MTEELQDGSDRNGTKPKRAKRVPGARLMTTFEVVEYSGLSEWKLRELVYARLIPVVDLDGKGGRSNWRFDRADIDQLITDSKKFL